MYQTYTMGDYTVKRIGLRELAMNNDIPQHTRKHESKPGNHTRPQTTLSLPEFEEPIAVAVLRSDRHGLSGESKTGCPERCQGEAEESLVETRIKFSAGRRSHSVTFIRRPVLRSYQNEGNAG